MMRQLIVPAVLSLATNMVFAHDVNTPTTIDHYSLDKVSEHIYVIHGTQELPNPRTRGFMNNPTAIIGTDGIIIVDPGSSVEIGRQVLKKVRKVSNKPIIAVFNTHVHGDHWLGNQGVREVYADVPIYAHDRMIERISQGEGDFWNKMFLDMTKGATKGTKVVAPTVGLQGGETLTLAGITLRIHHTGQAHTDHDIMIEVVNDRGLLFGDVVANKRVPNSDVPHDASFKGTIDAIEQMLKRPVKLYVPGHGQSGGREVPESSLQFLTKLDASVNKYYQQGLADFEMKQQVVEDLHQYRDWNNFQELGRVISHVYQEVEQENF